MRLSASIRPSRQKFIAYGGFVLMVFGLSAAMGFGLWQYVFCGVLAVGLFWSETLKPRPVYLVSGDELWQAKVTTTQQEQLWQFYVHQLHDFGWCVVLDGYVTEPNNKHIRWVFINDMMNFDDYCTLRALARFGGA